MEAFSAVALLATSAYLISRASEQPPILYLMVAVVGVRAFALGRATFRYLQRLALHDAVFRSLSALRPQLFKKLTALVPGQISSRGRALELFTADVDRLQDLPLRVINPLLQAFAAVLTMLAIAIWIFPFAAVPMVAVSVTFALAALWLSKLAASDFEAQRVKNSEGLRAELLGFISNVDVLTSYGWAQSVRNRIANAGNLIARTDARRLLPLAAATAILSLGSAFSAIVSAWLVAGSIEQILPSVLAVAVLMPLAVFDVFSQLQSVAQAFAGYKQSHLRLAAMEQTNLSAELDLTSGALELGSLETISCRNLSVSRSGSTVFSDLTTDFHTGHMFAVTGKSGAGKSTLALALASLLQPVEGEILFDGAPARNFTLESRRRNIVLIEQSPHVFRGTVEQNLEIAGEASVEQMLNALSLVGLDFEFADRGMLQAQLQENAANISGGQAQRLAIARGLLAGAKFLILDEPTSGLDRGNALALMEILRQLTGRRIGVILITHDEELAGLCDVSLDLTEWAAHK
jgi:ATP-binding cassette subfamily C protein CydC